MLKKLICAILGTAAIWTSICVIGSDMSTFAQIVTVAVCSIVECCALKGV